MHNALIIILVLLLLREVLSRIHNYWLWNYGGKMMPNYLLKRAIKKYIEIGKNKSCTIIRTLDRKPLLQYEKTISKKAKTTFRLIIYKEWLPEADDFDRVVQIVKEEVPHSFNITTRRGKTVLIVDLGRSPQLTTNISRQILKDVYKIDLSIKLRSCARGSFDYRDVSYGWDDDKNTMNDPDHVP